MTSSSHHSYFYKTVLLLIVASCFNVALWWRQQVRAGFSWNAAEKTTTLPPCLPLSAAAVSTNTTSTTSTTTAPLVQVFVVMTPAHGVNWERYYRNSIAWHGHFASENNLLSFTFDEVPLESPLHSVIHSMPTYEHEVSQQHSNLLLAAFQHVYERNPFSPWYFLTEDDTIVIPENLRVYKLVDKLQREKKHDTYMMYGNSVTYADPKDKTHIIHFVVGGGGMLMTNKLLSAMVPHIEYCRHTFNHIYFGDARVGACIEYTLQQLHRNIKWPPNTQSTFLWPPAPFLFVSGALPLPPADDAAIVKPASHNLVITLHEKNATRIQILNQAIQELTTHKQPVTYGALQKYVTWKAAE